MKLEDRRQQIVDLLMVQGSVTLEDLASQFGVSKMTIHRDLDDLEEAGLLRKVRGGASIETSSQFESDYRYRERRGAEEKKRIGRAAIEMLEPGMTVLVNDGSTAGLLADMLPDKRPITVITNNHAVIQTLIGVTGVTLIALGGAYSKKYNGFYGIITEEALARLRADVAFISSPAIQGTTAFHQDHEFVKIKRLMIAAGTKRYLLVDHLKFGRTALHEIADLRDFDAVITSQALPKDMAVPLRDADVNLIVAETDPQ
ncbi:DeoR faimly transcriptional regulator [Actibacterium mucosum KCTC 23349]|uniref:DeoR faimly transcriptional regulator n=1 Tax=Actibacterium mucosum KCTC 23349 TaxID=1454373 RepID=A0A037ZN12_9RHOB|nr:DeoR/GlpR family DNA-binding transcription regulator [Actibacterium mucosum]KAJ56231.1 DeoR faimly transcriptional regulator [Actibacterium mucosum KCTC 23349]